MTDDDRILAAWLCAECYGKHFIAGFKHGVTSQIDVSATRSTTITAHIGDATITLASRNYSKTSKYKHEFFDPHGIAPNGPIDTQYVSYWSNIGSSCWGVVKNEDAGSYSVSSQFENSMIYFADLREDLLVYAHETGNSSGSASGSAPLGNKLAYAEFNGTPGCQNINILDAIKMPLTISSTINSSELITVGGYTPSRSSLSSTRNTNVAASDRSGLCGGVAYGCYKFGNYAVVDESNPYDCHEGSYTELVSPEVLEDYLNTWDSFGTDRSMDDYDREIWNASFNEGGVNRLADGEHTYSPPISIDSLPHGSWCFDAEGDKFYSMITADFKTFNKLNALDPKEIAELGGSGVVFYPMGLL